MENYHIQPLISEEDLDAKVRELGAQISKDYEGKTIKVIGVLKGAVFAMCEISKRITVPVMLDFMCVSSYGNGTETSGSVKIIKDLDESITGQDVLIIEDIIDSGVTLSHLIEMLKQRNPASLKICALMHKPARTKVDIPIDYLGFTIPDKFVVGYGLDYAQKHRNLSYVGEVIFDEE